MAEVNIAKRAGGAQGAWWCSAKHPTADEVWCRRLKEHEGPHRAFVFLISEPEEWDV